MKNFPHQFNDLEKLHGALRIAGQMIQEQRALNDENFGESLTWAGIYTFRSNISIEEYLHQERQKPASNRGFQTVARDIRRLFELLGLLFVLPDKSAQLTISGKLLLKAAEAGEQHKIWRNAFLNLGLEGSDGEISHPYQILLRVVNTFPGIETKKLMLALEAENDSEEEFERIKELATIEYEEIVRQTGTSEAMAANAVKILPGVAEQLGDLERRNNAAFSVGTVAASEDEISTEPIKQSRKQRAAFRAVTADGIAKAPITQEIFLLNIDIAEAVRIRQQRLVAHQEIVRQLALLHEKEGFQLFEGKFDCLAIKNNTALLYEVKTLFGNGTDEEKQTVKGVGQLKFYQYSIILKQMGIGENVIQLIVFSRRPEPEILGFCAFEHIRVVWREHDSFFIFNEQTSEPENFSPSSLIDKEQL